MFVKFDNLKCQTLINTQYYTICMKEEIFFNHDKLKIVCEDVLSTDKIPKNSVDLIVTSPPYNVDIKYNSTIIWNEGKNAITF